jgi:LDH2 family malate/lactate/ureidoglycolate dehydrogenase
LRAVHAPPSVPQRPVLIVNRALGPEEVLPHLRGLGFSEADAKSLADHFLDAERRQKRGHGLVRLERLAERHRFDPGARPERVVAEPEFERWQGRDVLGYLMLAAICDAQLANPPRRARLVVASPCFPTGVLGYWTRRLAEGGLVAVLTATSPRRLGHPDGGPPLAGTNPVSIAVPSSDGGPLVADVSMGRVTFGDVLAGAATEEDLEPFGGEQAHKAFALAVGLQSLVDALAGPDEHGAVLLVARPEFDPVPKLRARAGDVRLPGGA